MRVLNFNDPVLQSDGDLVTLGNIGSASYIDASESIKSYSGRVNIDKKIMHVYKSGRVELYISGSYAQSLTSSQSSIISLTNSDYCVPKAPVVFSLGTSGGIYAALGSTGSSGNLISEFSGRDKNIGETFIISSVYYI